MEAQLLHNYYEAALAFRDEFDVNNDQIYYEVTQHICRTLFENADLPLYNPNHPFNQYGAPDTIILNIGRLAATLRANMDLPQERSALLSFVHPGGVNYDLLIELMEAYWEYVDYVMEYEDQDENQNQNQNQNQNHNHNMPLMNNP